jgi:hypothetical protein
MPRALSNFLPNRVMQSVGMSRGDHLSQQSQRQELDAYNNEQNAKE